MTQVQFDGYRLTLLKREKIGQYTFVAYDSDPYDPVEVIKDGRVVERTLPLDCEGP